MKLNLCNIFESINARRKADTNQPFNDAGQAGERAASEIAEIKYARYIEEKYYNGKQIDFSLMENLFKDDEIGSDSRYAFWELLREILFNKKIIKNNYTLLDNEMKFGQYEGYLENNTAYNNESQHLQVYTTQIQMSLNSLNETSFTLSIGIPAGEIYNNAENLDDFYQPIKFELQIKLNHEKFTAFNMFQILLFIKKIYDFVFSTGFYIVIKTIALLTIAELQTNKPSKRGTIQTKWEISNPKLFIETGIIVFIDYYLMDNFKDLDISLCNSSLFPDFKTALGDSKSKYIEYLNNDFICDNNEMLWEQITSENYETLGLIFKDGFICCICDFFYQFFIDNKCLPFNINDKIGNANDPRRAIKLENTLKEFCYPTVIL